MFRRIRSLIRKEMQILLGDRQGRMVLIIPVLLQIAVFPFAVSLEVKDAKLAIYNQDKGPASIEISQRLSSAPKTFSKVVFVESEAEMRDLIDEQKVLAAVRFSPDFSRSISRGESPQVQIVADGRRSNSGQLATSYITQVFQDWQQERAAASGSNTTSSTLVVRHWFNDNLDYTHFILPSLIGLITTIGVLIVTGLSVAREREQGTFDQLLVSPFTPEMIMIGKTVPAIIIATFQATLILLAAVFIYGVPFQGSLLLLYGCIILYAISLAGIGLLISSVCATQQQAFLGIFSFVMPAIMLSGFASPIENMPHWLQTLTWANPIRHFIEVVKGIYLKDIGLAHVAELALPLLIISVISMLAANVVFRKKAM